MLAVEAASTRVDRAVRAIDELSGAEGELQIARIALRRAGEDLAAIRGRLHQDVYLRAADARLF
jgi:hypothetical protein